MFRMEAQVFHKEFDCDDVRICALDKPVIYYLVHKDDKRPFFIIFVLINFLKKEITYIVTYNKKNRDIVNAQKDSQIYSMQRCVHCTLSINDNMDFLTFMEEENYFFYVNYKESYIDVYTMNDLVNDGQITFGKISSTFYKDPDNKDYFYISAAAEDNGLYLYRSSMDLKEVTLIDSFESNQWPPHVLRKYKHFLFVSHEFKNSLFRSDVTGKIITPQELKIIMVKKFVQYMNKTENNVIDKILNELKYEDKIVCMPGKVLLLNLKTLKKIYYTTSGGSPAHFEIDEKSSMLYTSSHNFIMGEDTIIFYEPAIIDKFRIHEDSLEHVSKFCFAEGYRYTTHKVFYRDGKTYLCTIAEPNRLLIISADSMELLYSYDIGENKLDAQDDIMIYINGKNKSFSYVALEVSEDGETIFFLDTTYLYLFSFSERRIYARVDYTLHNGEIEMDDYLIRTVHFNYLD